MRKVFDYMLSDECQDKVEQTLMYLAGALIAMIVVCWVSVW